MSDATSHAKTNWTPLVDLKGHFKVTKTQRFLVWWWTLHWRLNWLYANTPFALQNVIVFHPFIFSVCWRRIEKSMKKSTAQTQWQANKSLKVCGSDAKCVNLCFITGLRQYLHLSLRLTFSLSSLPFLHHLLLVHTILFFVTPLFCFLLSLTRKQLWDSAAFVPPASRPVSPHPPCLYCFNVMYIFTVTCIVYCPVNTLSVCLR